MYRSTRAGSIRGRRRVTVLLGILTCARAVQTRIEGWSYGFMAGQPLTWHYGLVAQYWAEFNVAAPEELAYYRAAIERYGQPALDLACGTGRILVPLLKAG